MSRRRRAVVTQEAVLRRCLRVVDASGIVPKAERWRSEDRLRAGKGLGGRPKVIGDRALLAVWLTLAATFQPMHVGSMAQLMEGLDDEILDELGIVRSAVTPDWYSRCWRSLHSLLDLIDPHPIRCGLGGDRRTKMTKAQFDALVAKRDPEETARRAERLAWSANALVEASLLECPREIRRRWQGNAAVDGTLVRAWGAEGTSKRSNWVASEPDGGWYCRGGDHSDTKANGERIGWGWELTLVAMCANLGDDPADFPLLALGVAFDRPGHQPGKLATSVFRSIVGRGHPAGLAIGDRAYLPGSKPENYQLPVRSFGYGHIGEYRVDMAAITVAEQGAIQVDGAWYCPSMPADLINASVDKRNGTIDATTWRARMNRRTAYLLRANGKPDADGYQRWRCPASGPSPTAACPLKGEPTKPGLTAVTLTPKHPDKVCTQQSITISPTPGAKWRQDIQYGTDAWQTEMGKRNGIESFNAGLKRTQYGALDSPGNRQVRGRTAAFAFTAMIVVAENLRLIDNFVADQGQVPALKPRTKRRRDLPGGWGEESPLRQQRAGPAPPAAA